MTETSPPAPPDVNDQRTNPPGILPRNTQAWVLAGIALLMVGIIALPGKNQSKERTPKAPVGSVIDPNTARIQEYEKRIEEQAQKVRLEQAQLAQTQQALSNLPAPASGSPRAPESAAPRYVPMAVQEDSIQAEERKREYRSRFASNIALSYRKEVANAAPRPLRSLLRPSCQDRSPPTATRPRCQTTDGNLFTAGVVVTSQRARFDATAC